MIVPLDRMPLDDLRTTRARTAAALAEVRKLARTNPRAKPRIERLRHALRIIDRELERRGDAPG